MNDQPTANSGTNRPVEGAGRLALWLAVAQLLFAGLFWALRLDTLAVCSGTFGANLLLVYAGLSGVRRGYRRGTLDMAVLASRQQEADERLRAAELEPCGLDLSTWPVHPDPEAGYVYVIKFSSGAVKVGQTRDPGRRFTEHRRDAAAYKVWIVDFWISPAHRGYLDNEVDLISLCADHGARAKREYFHDIDFGDARRYAESLSVSAPGGGTP